MSPLKHAPHQIVLLRQMFNNLAVTLLKITEWLLQTENRQLHYRQSAAF